MKGRSAMLPACNIRATLQVVNPTALNRVPIVELDAENHIQKSGENNSRARESRNPLENKGNRQNGRSAVSVDNSTFDNLAALYYEPSSQRVTCPLCLAERGEKSRILKIGQGAVKCFGEVEHRVDIVNYIHGLEDAEYEQRRKDAAYRQRAIDEATDEGATSTSWAILRDALTLSPGDVEGAEKIIIRAWRWTWETHKETLRVTYAVGLVLNGIQSKIDHGQWQRTLENCGIEGEGGQRWARRAMKVATIDGAADRFNSVNAALESVKDKNRKPDKKSLRLAALEKENKELRTSTRLKGIETGKDDRFQRKIRELETDLKKRDETVEYLRRLLGEIQGKLTATEQREKDLQKILEKVLDAELSTV